MSNEHASNLYGSEDPALVTSAFCLEECGSFRQITFFICQYRNRLLQKALQMFEKAAEIEKARTTENAFPG